MDAIAVSDTPAFEVFFEGERHRLLRALYLLTGNVEEAQEVLQDAYVAVWERWDRSALNRYRSGLRRTARAARRAVGRAHGGDLFAAADERVVLAQALARLTPRRREAIVLTELLGYGSAEAGRIMGIADVTVRRLAQDARAELRTALEETDGA